MVNILLIIFFISICPFEIFLAFLSKSRLTNLISILACLFIACISLSVLILYPSAWSILIGYFSLFRVINIFRLIDNRKQPIYLKSVFIRSAWFLVGFQVIILMVALLSVRIDLSYRAKWDLVALMGIAISLVIFYSIRRSLIKTKPIVPDSYIKDNDLPSITVAIPARNETTDLEECLNSLIASDYPKLEILVLDDCSQNKHTPEIIRQFAHDGVRFVAGKIPPDSWTAKNFAYQQLSEEANGKYIMFCGVDVRFSSDSVRKMIELMIYKKKRMISFIPLNVVPSGSIVKALSLQPWRYFWELGIPRRRLNRPPVLSTCWIIDKSSLIGYGSFKAVSRNILPERYFAGQAVYQHDGYSFIRAGQSLGLSCNKNYHEQFQTAVRTRYPSLRQRLELVALWSLIELIAMVMPLVILIVALFNSLTWVAIVGFISLILCCYSFYKVSSIAYSKTIYLSLILMPVLVFYDIYMLISSMWKYEFEEVIWKDRNVCIPVMRVEPKLPLT